MFILPSNQVVAYSFLLQSGWSLLISPPISSGAVHSLLQPGQSMLIFSSNQDSTCSLSPPISSGAVHSLLQSRLSLLFLYPYQTKVLLLLFSNKEKAMFLFQSRKGFIDVSSNEICSSRCSFFILSNPGSLVNEEISENMSKYICTAQKLPKDIIKYSLLIFW